MQIEADPLELFEQSKYLGISQNELCRRAGWARSQWTRWKTGRMKTAPRLDKVIALNQVLAEISAE